VKLSAIDLNVLVALDAVLSERSVTRAAQRIGRSQPATSHALNRARGLFDDPLLVRVRGQLELTARARTIAPRIHRVLRELGAVLDAHRDFDPAAIECVTIGATDYVGFVLVPHVVAVLQSVAPRLSVRLRTVEGLDALEPVTSGAVDLAVGTFPQIPAGLRVEDLFTEDFVCVRRRGRGKRAARLSVDDLSAMGHVLVASPASGRGPVDHALASRGRARHIAAYVPQFLVAPSIVAQTDLVLTTARRIAERLAPALGLDVLAPPFALAPFTVRMIWHPRTDDDTVGRWLRTVLRDATTRLLGADKPGEKRKQRKKAAGARGPRRGRG
jgi:DNA-binding transcriptional LysR family regulator